MRIKVKVETTRKVLDIEFNYDREKDTPEGIVDEMRREFGLKRRK